MTHLVHATDGDLPVIAARHRGPCSPAAFARFTAALRRAGAAWDPDRRCWLVDATDPGAAEAVCAAARAAFGADAICSRCAGGDPCGAWR